MPLRSPPPVSRPGSPAGLRRRRPDDLNRLFIVEKSGQIKILDLATGTVAGHAVPQCRQKFRPPANGACSASPSTRTSPNGYFYVNLINTAATPKSGAITFPPTNPNWPIRERDPHHPHRSAGRLPTTRPAGSASAPTVISMRRSATAAAATTPHNGQNIEQPARQDAAPRRRRRRVPRRPDRNYAIPPTTRSSASPGADEICALGLRNPWRHELRSRARRLLHRRRRAGRMGGDRHRAPAPTTAGTRSKDRVPFPETARPGTLTFPIHVYDHSVGQSITGGYVYRGTSEGLQGHYFFADFVAQIFTLHFDGTAGSRPSARPRSRRRRHN